MVDAVFKAKYSKDSEISVQREATGWLQDPSWPNWLARITTLSVRRHGQPSKTPPIGLRVMCQRTPIREDTTKKSTCSGKSWRRKDWSSTTSTGLVFTLLTAGSTTVASSAELVFVALVPPRLAKECGRGGRGRRGCGTNSCRGRGRDDNRLAPIPTTARSCSSAPRSRSTG